MAIVHSHLNYVTFTIILKDTIMLLRRTIFYIHYTRMPQNKTFTFFSGLSLASQYPRIGRDRKKPIFKTKH